MVGLGLSESYRQDNLAGSLGAKSGNVSYSINQKYINEYSISVPWFKGVKMSDLIGLRGVWGSGKIFR